MTSSRYIAVSGNSGTGKSTLVGAIAREAHRRGQNVQAINERLLHHPHVPSMFAEPELFALPIQLHFMVARHLALIEALRTGGTVVIERSHLDDQLFVDQHCADGTISHAEADAHGAIWRALAARLPPPDLMVLLDVPAEVSIERILADERAARRPKEFPDRATLEHYVRSWHPRYERFHAILAADPTQPPRTLHLNGGGDCDEMATHVCDELDW
jgi:deoxyadenosine/deoxycytidine kinase